VKALKLSSKRQVVLPKSVCDTLRIKPGDHIKFEKRDINGEAFYCILADRPSWFGVFRNYAKGKAHDMDSIREGIAKGRMTEWEERYGKPAHQSRNCAAKPKKRNRIK
jgi:AbrB family looped-hinge helix DNA binding protein